MSDKTVRPFPDFLMELNSGNSAIELAQKLHELVTAVCEVGKVGTLTYVIKVGPNGNAEGSVMITDDVKLKLPVGARSDSVWFVTPDGNVSRHNPDQMRLPLREVRGPRPAPDEATDEGGVG